MGNTRIQDSATGNIMSLSPGFIPVGMKEHGGIMYIASVNKDGQGEIGTIPSPIIRDMYKDRVSIPFNTTIPVDTGDPIQITNKLYPADKFIANLQMTIVPNNLKGILHTKKSGLSVQDKDPCDIVLERQICNTITPDGRIYSNSLYSPVISYSANSEDNIYIDELEYPRFIRKKGIYKLNLYSSPEEDKSVIASENLLSSQVYGPNGENKSQYWFLHTDSPTTVFPKDLFNATLNKDLKQVPVSNKPGKLAIELIPESITDFGMLPRGDKLYVPITYKTNDGKYHTYFPGFYYTSDSGLYVEKLTARVIDESTNLEVDLVYPYGKEVLFGRFNLSGISFKSFDDYTNTFCNGGLRLWEITDELGLPHQRSKDYPNTQILSPIAGLFDHTQTSFQSSTQDKDDSPHSGVFYADLGDKYKNWYRLEVDYEDQYGGNKGTFTTRFNPYINDVFGTNLSVEDYVLFDPMIIGSSYSRSSLEIKTAYMQTTQSYTKCIGWWKSQADDRTKYDWFDTVGVKMNSGIISEPKTFSVFSNENSSGISFYINVTINDQEAQKYTDPSFNSYFKYVYQDAKLECTLQDPQIVLQSIKIFGNGSAHPAQFMKKDTNGGVHRTKVRTQESNHSNSVFFNDRNQQYYSNGGNKINWTAYYGEDEENTEYPKGYILLNIDSEDPLFSELAATLNKKQYSYGLSDVKTLLDLRSRYTYTGTFPGSLKMGMCESYMEGSYWVDEIQYVCRDNNMYLYVQPTYEITSISNTIPTQLFNPSYSIVPYFLLQGTSNNREKVYTQRFGKEGNTDIVYQHNFEQDDKGEVKNYFYDDFSEPTQSKIIQCSYNHETHFYYYNEKLAYNDILSPGIYILNIARVPGKATDSDRFNQGVSLSIKIGEEEKTFNEWQWVATPDYYNMNNFLDRTDGLIYRPIVLIIQESANVHIGTDAGFYRQNIGLFKISGVNDSQSIIELQNTIPNLRNIMFYDDYMYELEHQPVIFERVEKYNFIQKYGVFFKEAYVFIDGLLDAHSNISGVTIGETTYGSYPYIPYDPSVLPTKLSTEAEYIWNAYVMPESILDVTDDKYPNFIFSTPLDQKSFSTKPDAGNLRQFVEQ